MREAGKPPGVCQWDKLLHGRETLGSITGKGKKLGLNRGSPDKDVRQVAMLGLQCLLFLF